MVETGPLEDDVVLPFADVEPIGALAAELSVLFPDRLPSRLVEPTRVSAGIVVVAVPAFDGEVALLLEVEVAAGAGELSAVRAALPPTAVPLTANAGPAAAMMIDVTAYAGESLRIVVSLKEMKVQGDNGAILVPAPLIEPDQRR